MDEAVDLYRRRLIGLFARGCAIAPFMTYSPCLQAVSGDQRPKEVVMRLPKEMREGKVSVERALADRRTVRSFSSRPLSREKFSQILWAGQGVTEEGGFKRSAPSAGALYPGFLYAAAGKDSVEGIDAGLYRYIPEGHGISRISEGDIRDELARSSLSQTWIARAPVDLVICADYNRITGKYGERGIRYAMIEAGHIAQNVFLQAVALGLSAGIVGAFIDKEVIKTMGIPETHTPLLVMPVGYKR